MRVKLPGLWEEKLPSGAIRCRVRKEGDKRTVTNLPVGRTDPDFLHHYYAARQGDEWHPAKENVVAHSLDWLVKEYLHYLENSVAAKTFSEKTLVKRRSYLTRLCDFRDKGERYGDFDIDAPKSAFIRARDAWADRPSAADELIKSLSAMYTWAGPQGQEHTLNNPVLGIPKISKKAVGAIPWTAADIKAFKEAHPKGTTAHLWLTLQAFTACRVGDALWVGRSQEKTRSGALWLDFQPRKKGSAFVSIPMAPPLVEATRAATVVGSSYILNENGKPYSSVEGLRVRIARWCETAGLVARSSHGVRKATGELMAEAGSSQYQIMAVMSHTEARTSEIYTKGAERRVLAAASMQALNDLNW